MFTISYANGGNAEATTVDWQQALDLARVFGPAPERPVLIEARETVTEPGEDATSYTHVEVWRFADVAAIEAADRDEPDDTDME